MRVLYTCRIFTGLERSLFRRSWEPTGVPTIYKMIEALDRDPGGFRLVLTGKKRDATNYTNWEEKGNIELSVKGLQHPLLVLGGVGSVSAIPAKYQGPILELRQAIRTFFEIARFKPDLLYFDHANIWSAGLAARFLRLPVVLRVMGVYPAMMKALTGPRLIDKLLRWLYKSPFDLVICTQDGSSSREWLQKALQRKVRRETVINGFTRSEEPVPADSRWPGIPEDRTLILFVGKLEKPKGCIEFVDALLSLYPRLSEQLHALVVGTGNLRQSLMEKVASAGASSMFTFIDRMPHKQVMEAHARSDIYVSLNRFGNLSNANLEAMMAGDCMIILESDPIGGYDLVTDDLLPQDTVCRIGRHNVVPELAKAIEHLHRHPEERIERGRRTREAASMFIPTWEKRIAWELDCLRKLSAKSLLSGQPLR